MIVGALTWIAFTCLLMQLTWDIGISWPSLNNQLSYLYDAVIDTLFYQSNQKLINYWRYIESSELALQLTLHCALPAILAIYPAYILGRMFYISGGRDRLIHISGPLLRYYSSAFKHARKIGKKECGKSHRAGLFLHPKLSISRVRESGNIFVCGAQGSGKTVFITPLIDQVIQRGERAFIYDEKREFTALFYHPGSTLLIAPWDTRSAAWDIQADASNAVQAQLIAEHLIHDSDDPLWANGARSIFAGMIEVLNHSKETWGWQDLAHMLTTDESTLHKLLSQHYPRAARFIAEESKTTQSFFAQLNGSLGWIFTLAEAWPDANKATFSIYHWARNSKETKSVVIVQADKRYKDIGAPLANAMIALMTSSILSQANSLSRELWLFIDELANLPRNDSLQQWMALGRSKGCRLVAGTQSISQLKKIYSEHGADNLMNMFTIFGAMRLGAVGETATQAAKSFGEREVERPTSSAGPKERPAQNWHRETLPLVTASDLVHLPQPNSKGVEGYLLIPGYQSVYRLKWPYPRLSANSEEHLPARWLAQSSSKKSDGKARPSSRLKQLQSRRAKYAVDERNS